MKIVNEPKIMMFGSLAEYLNQDNLLSAIPKYNNLKEKYKEKHQLIKDCVGKLLISTSGYTEQKNMFRKDVVKITLDFSNMITLYARECDMKVLEKEVNTSNSELSRLSSLALSEKAKSVLESAFQHESQLKEYGIQPEMITNFKDLIEKYDDSLPQLRMNIAGRRKLKQELNEGIAQINEIIDSFDKFAYSYKDKDPNFWIGYKTVRTIVETRTSSMAMRGLVTDSSSGEPIEGAVIEIINNNGSSKIIKKRSALRGGFAKRSLPAGTYHFITTKPGYLPKTQEVIIESYVQADVKISLDKI